jgi:hypothetical protein
MFSSLSLNSKIIERTASLCSSIIALSSDVRSSPGERAGSSELPLPSYAKTCGTIPATSNATIAAPIMPFTRLIVPFR